MEVSQVFDRQKTHCDLKRKISSTTLAASAVSIRARSLVWPCAPQLSSTNMIEGPFARPDPSHNPVGREHMFWNHESLPHPECTPNVDDICQDEQGDQSARRSLVRLGAAEQGVEVHNDEGTQPIQNEVEALGDIPQGPMMQRESGETASKTEEQLRHGKTEAVAAPVFFSETLPASVDSILQQDSSTSSDVGNGKLADTQSRRCSQNDSILQTPKKEKVLKLTPEKIHELTSSPHSLPLRALDFTDSQPQPSNLPPPSFKLAPASHSEGLATPNTVGGALAGAISITKATTTVEQQESSVFNDSAPGQNGLLPLPRPVPLPRAYTSSSAVGGPRSPQSRPGPTGRRSSKHAPTPLRFDDGRAVGPNRPIMEDVMPSPMPQTIPLPPMSLPTYLQLELSSHRPSPLYIHRSMTSDFPYESSLVKIERLLNFLLLPPQLEQVLWFGTFACLDAWLYTFTILPLRLFKSFYILWQSWVTNLLTEIHFVSSFIYTGMGRMWRRRRTRGNSASTTKLDGQGSASANTLEGSGPVLSEMHEKTESVDVATSVRDANEKRRPSLKNRNTTDESGRKVRRHRRTKSVPSGLLPGDKADILKGLLIITTCLILMRLDASRMYHWIRGQAAMKLYVIYNVLEVGDRLLSAIGQDVLECLFSREALERGPDGHSKVLRPFWLFLLALAYTVTHSTALFYQVITLNVAVNSYSNALITLLISNQFVEIKSTVFKKFEKENLFQLTCADVVERFQLWLMLLIIASRNFVETLGAFPSTSSFVSASATNSSNPLNTPPLSASSILPRSFTLLPNMLSSLTAYAPGIGHVLGPFLVVLGSEMLVDWLKHSYISKFNNTRPAIYGRFLDVLAKDYYSNAFAEQNLTRRLGLPVIPLSCLFIRASVQTYHMFLAAWIPPTLISSATGLTSAYNHYTTAPSSMPTSTAAALSKHFDDLIRQLPTSISSSTAFANFSTILTFLLVFLVLLTLKLVLGMLLLAFARSRYRSMKEREKKNPIHHVEGGRRVGGWGVVEVDDDKRRWIYEGDEEGKRQLREREEREKIRREQGVGEGVFDKVKRYDMVAKRIW
jgi:Eukaryotic membrane protein family